MSSDYDEEGDEFGEDLNGIDDDEPVKECKPWIPYSARENWRDVQPIEQDDGPNPIVCIAYSQRCK